MKKVAAENKKRARKVCNFDESIVQQKGVSSLFLVSLVFALGRPSYLHTVRVSDISLKVILKLLTVR